MLIPMPYRDNYLLYSHLSLFSMTTTKSISLFCGIFLACTLLLTSFFINIFFYFQWTNKVENILVTKAESTQEVNPDLLHHHFVNVVSLEKDNPLGMEMKQHPVFTFFSIFG